MELAMSVHISLHIRKLGMKYVTMELGGKSPLIILNNAVERAMMANFFSTGQVCINGTRVFVHDSMKASFEKRLLEKIRFVRMGDVFDPSTNFGLLVSKVHYEKVSDTASKKIKQPSYTAALLGPAKSIYDSMKITRQEIFGPVTCILSILHD